MNIVFATVNGGFAQAYPSVAPAMGFLFVLSYPIVVFCLFDNFTMNWLDPFSVIYMAEAGVTFTTIWHKAAIDSFRFSCRC